jgi:hypothetical protein
MVAFGFFWIKCDRKQFIESEKMKIVLTDIERGNTFCKYVVRNNKNEK